MTCCVMEMYACVQHFEVLLRNKSAFAIESGQSKFSKNVD